MQTLPVRYMYLAIRVTAVSAFWPVYAKLCSWATIFEDKKQKWLKAEDAVWSPLLSTDTVEAGKPPLSGMM